MRKVKPVMAVIMAQPQGQWQKTLILIRGHDLRKCLLFRLDHLTKKKLTFQMQFVPTIKKGILVIQDIAFKSS